MRKFLILLPLLFSLSSCGFLQAADVDPVVEGVHGLDAKYQELRGGMQKLLNYGLNNGMPMATWQVYQQFVEERTTDFERLRIATLAACADLGDVSLTEVLAAAQTSAVEVQGIIDNLRTDREGTPPGTEER